MQAGRPRSQRERVAVNKGRGDGLRPTAERGLPAMRITWYGHAAFLIETLGSRIILDPYKSPDSGGYEPIGEPADVVVVSHENDRYHSHLGQLVPPFEVVRGLEIAEGGTPMCGIRFDAVRVFETPERQPEDE